MSCNFLHLIIYSEYLNLYLFLYLYPYFYHSSWPHASSFLIFLHCEVLITFHHPEIGDQSPNQLHMEPPKTRSFITLELQQLWQRFLTKRAFKNHILGHTGEKPSQLYSLQTLKLSKTRCFTTRTRICESCHKQFMSKLVSKSHKLGHTGEKPLFGLEFVTSVTTMTAKRCLEEPYTWPNWSSQKRDASPHWQKAI